MGSYMQAGVAQQKQTPSTAASAAQLQKISMSMSTRQTVYAARDAASSVDPGTTLTTGPDTIEEESDEDEEDETIEGPDLSGEAKTPAEKFAKKILQKSRQSGVPDSMWRSFAG